MSVSTELKDIDFLQEKLDFSNTTPEDFERLVFHLLDEMGFSNLSWRKGGEGNSATDGGRDLEATFWTVKPIYSAEEKYWFEVKYRKKQLAKSNVQKTVLNAAGHRSKDNLVIITNGTVSNPTLDWVKQFQESHKEICISIWQGHDLELLLRKNPRTLARFVPASLAFSGRCKVVVSKFSNLALLPAGGELDELWIHRDKVFNDSYTTLIAILAEVSYGNINRRQWGLEISESDLFLVAIAGIVDLYPILSVCKLHNRNQGFLVDGMSYIIQCLIIRLGVELASKALFNPEKLIDQAELPDNLKVSRLLPIYDNVFHCIANSCSKKFCSKVRYIRHAEDDDYFVRFVSPPRKDEEEYNILYSSNGDCKIGLVGVDEFCPLGEKYQECPKTEIELIERLDFFRKVLLIRTREIM
ncbi:restriction endonuclease [Hahella sp. HN01]|uniref:restriction endonuclease n=1 Tax=Hahella sp. HN01 TaxID=2847262 RepID=UPI001C1EBDA7|nr:restriction endonuclease [Hahella sp. HN01]MBU6954548.1 restriction endonuclease [Hahella sp. HN01]